MNASSISKLRLLLPAMLFSVLALAHGEGARQASPELRAEANNVIEMLFQFQPDETLKLLETSSAMDDDLKTFFSAWCQHQKGNYNAVATLLESLDPSTLPADGMIQERFVEMKKTALALREFEVRETEHFSIRFQKGRDEVLLFFMPEILESFYRYYTDFFGVSFDEKIIVELMPNHELFSYACALTREQIETTGTVALCVENRLAMITPRRVLKGYDWAHVLSHEFIHYILTKTSRNNAPLWFQEGVAKAFESHWDVESPSALDASLAHALATGLKAERLVTMEEMHPSFAALPTPELAHRAYAQVASMVDYMTKMRGIEVIPNLAHQLANQGDLNTLIESELSVPFETFENQWLQWAKDQNYAILPHMEYHKVKLLDEDGGEESLAQNKASGETERKHRRLGDLLLERDRFQAALIEYEKTLGALRQENPETPMDRQLILRFLHCQQALAFYEPMKRLIDREVLDLKDDSTMLQFSAEALFKTGKTDLALAQLDQAKRINPFDPGIFTLQQEIATQLDRKPLLEEAEAILHLLN